MPQMSISLCPVFRWLSFPSKSKRQTDSALVCFGLLSGSFQYTHLSDFFFRGPRRGTGACLCLGPGGWMGGGKRSDAVHITSKAKYPSSLMYHLIYCPSHIRIQGSSKHAPFQIAPSSAS